MTRGSSAALKARWPPEAKTQGADALPRVGLGHDPIEKGAGIAVEGGDGLLEFEEVASFGAGSIVGERRAGGLVLVIHLGNQDLKALASEAGSQPPDGCSDLVNLGIENDSGTRPDPFRNKAMDPHRADGSGYVDVFLILNGHDTTKNASRPWLNLREHVNGQSKRQSAGECPRPLLQRH
jgi:hypothetical protein